MRFVAVTARLPPCTTVVKLVLLPFKLSVPLPFLTSERTPLVLVLKTDPLTTKSPSPPNVTLPVAEEPMSTAPLKVIFRSGLLLLKKRLKLVPELWVIVLVALVKVRVAAEPLLLVKYILAPAVLAVP